MSLKEEGKLGTIEKFKLFYHTLICIYCKRFQIQTGYFIKNAKENLTKESISEETKNKILESLR